MSPVPAMTFVLAGEGERRALEVMAVVGPRFGETGEVMVWSEAEDDGGREELVAEVKADWKEGRVERVDCIGVVSGTR